MNDGVRLIDANALLSEIKERRQDVEQRQKRMANDLHLYMNCGARIWELIRQEAYVKSMQTIDAVPVVHARWSDEDTERYVCTVCGKWFFIDSGDGDMNYCPNCGAKMDETNPE